MFTRSSSSDQKPPEHRNGSAGMAREQAAGPDRLAHRLEQRAKPAEPASFSVISNDLKIIGQNLKIVSRGTLQVDGEVEGDVAGTEIIIGELGQVRGSVAAERVTVQGQISGTIRAVSVALQPSARVDGEIHHLTLVIERGATFDGRCRRPADAAELALDAHRQVPNRT